MAEYILPALSTSIAALTFIQKSIIGVIQIRDQIKDAPKEFVPLLCDVRSVDTKLEIWKDFWHLQEGVPASLPEKYWGVGGSQMIQLLLGNISTDCEELREHFVREYSFHTSYTSYTENPQPVTWSEQNLVAIIRQYRGVYKNKSGLFKQVKDGVYKVDRIQNMVKRLQRHLLSLFSMCEDEFDREQRTYFSQPEVREVAIKKISDKILLTMIPSLTERTSGDILKLKYHIDPLYLKIGQWWNTENAESHSRLEDTFSTGEFEYHLSHLSKNGMIDLHVSKSELNGSATKIRNITRVIEEMQQIRGSTSSLYTVISANCYKIYAERTSQCEGKSLRHLLCTIPVQTLADSLRSEFTIHDRVKLIFELAQTTLILIRTKWLSTLCSCSVQRRVISDKGGETDFEYFIRLGKFHHTDPVAGPDKTILEYKQWCESQLLGKHICRQGILLVEVALGSPVADADYDTDRGEIGIDEDVSTFRNCEGIRATLPCKIGQKIRLAAGLLGEDLRKAVLFCLGLIKTHAEIDKIDILNFYNKVYEPLFQHYRNHIKYKV